MKLVGLIFFAFLVTSLVFGQANNSLKNGNVKQAVPVSINHQWSFVLGKDTLKYPKHYFDTIHFQVLPKNQLKYIAIKDRSLVFFKENLDTIYKSPFQSIFRSESYLFIRNDNTWTGIQVESDSLFTFQADSIRKTDQGVFIFHHDKMGTIIGKKVILPNYDRISLFHHDDNFHHETYYLTLLGGKFGLLNQHGEELIPPVASFIQNYMFGVIRFKETNWKYLLQSNTIVDSKGCDVDFFDFQTYKIYDKSRSRSQFFVGETWVGQVYEDIFPLENERFYAFRNGKQVGLLNDQFKVIVPAFCDQLLSFDYDNDPTKKITYFKFLKDNKWGVVTSTGQILVEANYDHVFDYSVIDDTAYFEVAIKYQNGIVNQYGKLIIPCAYEDVNIDGQVFIVGKNKKVGCFNKHRKLTVPIEYNGYNKFDHIYIFNLGSNYYFVDAAGDLISKKWCNDYEFTKNVLKCYYTNSIEVYTLDKGFVTEVSTYENILSIQIQKDKRYYNTHRFFQKTDLELNQLTGLYGARYKREAGFAFRPFYTEIKHSIFSNSFISGVIKDTSVSLSVAKFPTLKALQVYYRMDCVSGNFDSNPILTSDVYTRNNYSQSSEDVFVNRPNKRLNFLLNSKKDIADYLIEQKGLIYIKRLDQHYQKVMIGGNVELVPISKADMSLMDYFHFLNQGCNLWFDSESQAKLLMNPMLGIRFVNAEVAVRDVRSNYRKPFESIVDDIRTCTINGLWRFQLKGIKEWVLSTDLSDSKRNVEGIHTIDMLSNATLLLSKLSNGTLKYGVYSAVLVEVLPVKFDKIIYAGKLGYLVCEHGRYYYIKE